MRTGANPTDRAAGDWRSLKDLRPWPPRISCSQCSRERPLRGRTNPPRKHARPLTTAVTAAPSLSRGPVACSVYSRTVLRTKSIPTAGWPLDNEPLSRRYLGPVGEVR
jgi:hypothetical protein